MSGLPDKSKERVYSDVIKIIARRENVATDGKTAVFSFKPTKLSEKAVTFIENVALSDESLSSFYRRMFMSYASRPQPRRELIIFKENYNDLQKAIRKNLQVCIVNKGDEIKKTRPFMRWRRRKKNFTIMFCQPTVKTFTPCALQT
ncbi:MAG: hypothetical protein L6V85_04125 [Clostridiales bacterium]|nr:MAG: hypothetical protein L6V85_04125 [Clostridiales bacterium]